MPSLCVSLGIHSSVFHSVIVLEHGWGFKKQVHWWHFWADLITVHSHQDFVLKKIIKIKSNQFLRIYEMAKGKFKWKQFKTRDELLLSILILYPLQKFDPLSQVARLLIHTHTFYTTLLNFLFIEGNQCTINAMHF